MSGWGINSEGLALKQMKRGFEYWTEFGICDSCGQDALGIEFWNSEMENEDITCQLCLDCLKKLGKYKNEQP